MKKYILLLLVLFIFITGCNDNLTYKDIMKKYDYVIIDVRTKEEYDSKHIKGAINIIYSDINESISLDKNKKIFVYCLSGTRSKIAYNSLKKLGYDVYDLGSINNIDLELE